MFAGNALHFLAGSVCLGQLIYKQGFDVVGGAEATLFGEHLAGEVLAGGVDFGSDIGKLLSCCVLLLVQHHTDIDNFITQISRLRLFCLVFLGDFEEALSDPVDFFDFHFKSSDYLLLLLVQFEKEGQRHLYQLTLLLDYRHMSV